MILLIDNYDSFTYNLVQRIGEIDPNIDMKVVRNDAVTIDDIEAMKPEKIIISPGPCTPAEAGVSRDVVRRFSETTPILGVCLGHQCIGHTYGGIVDRARRPMHGKTSLVTGTTQWTTSFVIEPPRVDRLSSSRPWRA